MSFISSIVKTTSVLIAVLAGLSAMAGEKSVVLEENPFGGSTTNSNSTNGVRKLRPLNPLADRPREFGFFSPLRTPVPESFGGGNISPVMPSMPRPVIIPPKEDSEDKGKGWIFKKSEDVSVDEIFKVKNFGTKDSEKEKKTQSGFAKYVASEAKNDEKAAQNEANARTAKKDADKYDSRTTATAQEQSDKSKQTDSFRDFSSRNPSQRDDVENRANDVTTHSSVFGEFFRGNHVAEARWAEQAAIRRNEFDQMFESRNPTETSKSLTPGIPTITAAPSDFTRAAANNGSDPWKNDLRSFSGNRSSFDSPNTRQLGAESRASSFATPTATRPQYQPAVLPFPKRPGELFK